MGQRDGRVVLVGRGWPEGGGHISSPRPYRERSASVELSGHGGVGVGVCGGVPCGVPHALPFRCGAGQVYRAP